MCFTKDVFHYVDCCNSEEPGHDALIDIAIQSVVKQGCAKTEAAELDIRLRSTEHSLSIITACLEAPEVLDFPK